MAPLSHKNDAHNDKTNNTPLSICTFLHFGVAIETAATLGQIELNCVAILNGLNQALHQKSFLS